MFETQECFFLLTKVFMMSEHMTNFLHNKCTGPLLVFAKLLKQISTQALPVVYVRL